MKLLGNKAGTGIALAKSFVIKSNKSSLIELDNKIIDVELEKNKVKSVFSRVLEEYEQMSLKNQNDKVIKELLDFYKMILLSNGIKEKIFTFITEEKYSAGKAIEKVFDDYEKQLEAVDNDYLKERSSDVRNIKNKIIDELYGIKKADLSNLKEEVILVSKEIDVSLLLNANKKMIKGIISEIGSKTSHLAIIANSLGIPTIFGIKNVEELIKNDETIFLDGNKGIVYTDLDEKFVGMANREIKKGIETEEKLKEMSFKEAITLDGKKFDVAINSGDINELSLLDKMSNDGIGLFRTEFLFLNRNEEPTEEELFKVYKDFAIKLGDKPFIIRTLDIGGDKKAPYIQIDKEDNPFLGYRAIRYCLDHKEFFKTSLRAILRASNYGNIMIMYPMISSLSEIEDANIILEEAKKELDIKKIPYNKNIKIGVMVEIPSIAVYADLIIKKVDFFSIGTNDLVQYSLAVDRLNNNVNKYYDWFNPGVIRLIKLTIEATKQYPNKFVGMCGELAADPLGIILLIGLGLDEFSVNIGSVLKTKKLISMLNTVECKKVVEEVILKDSGTEIRKILDKYAKEVYEDYY